MDRINNNIKFYTFIDILKTYSDKDVSLSIREINNHMKRRLGVVLDRRTIYNYLKDMKELGFDVSDYDKNKEGYYLNSHSLEGFEIKILSDAIITSNFITEKKTFDLLKKLKSFSSVYQNNDLLTRVFIEHTPKSSNEEIFSNLTTVSEAIKDGKRVSFNYCNYDYFRNLVCEKDDFGNEIIYVKNPIYLVLRNKNYYLVCVDDDCKVSNFRVDKMMNVIKSEEEIRCIPKCMREGHPIGLCESTRKNFKLYSKTDFIVIVEFSQKLFDYFLDHFGDHIFIMEKGNLSKHNLREDIKYELFNYQILEKILGSKAYEEYILSGTFLEYERVKVILDDFKKKLYEIIDDFRAEEGNDNRESGKYAETAEDKAENVICCNKRRIICKNVEYIEKDFDLADDVNCGNIGINCENNNDRKYLGVFVAKDGDGLARWIMQFGTDVEIVYPDKLRDEIKEELEKMRGIYF